MRAEDCPIHQKPYHRVDPLNRLLLGFLGCVFAGGIPTLDLSFSSIASADWESVFKTSWVKSNLTQNSGRCCIRTTYIVLFFGGGGDVKEETPESVKSLFFTAAVDLKQRRDGTTLSQSAL